MDADAYQSLQGFMSAVHFVSLFNVACADPGRVFRGVFERARKSTKPHASRCTRHPEIRRRFSIGFPGFIRCPN